MMTGMMVIIVIVSHMRRALTQQAVGRAARVALYLLIWRSEALLLWNCLTGSDVLQRRLAESGTNISA